MKTVQLTGVIIMPTDIVYHAISGDIGADLDDIVKIAQIGQIREIFEQIGQPYFSGIGEYFGESFVSPTPEPVTRLAVNMLAHTNEREDGGELVTTVIVPIWALDALIRPIDPVSVAVHKLGWQRLRDMQQKQLTAFIEKMEKWYGDGYAIINETRTIYPRVYNDVTEDIEPCVACEYITTSE